MNVSVRSVLMSGMTVATVGVIALAPVSPIAPDIARLSKHEFTLVSMPIRVKNDLQAIRQPSVDFRQRCGAPVTPLIGQG